MIWAVWGALLGAACGSFLAAARWRHQRGWGLEGRSVCSFCQEPLEARLNIPVVSWLWLRGRSRCCGHRLDPLDFIFEVGGVLAGALLGYFLGPLALLGGLLLVVLLALLWT